MAVVVVVVVVVAVVVVVVVVVVVAVVVAVVMLPTAAHHQHHPGLRALRQWRDLQPPRTARRAGEAQPRGEVTNGSTPSRHVMTMDQ